MEVIRTTAREAALEARRRAEFDRWSALTRTRVHDLDEILMRLRAVAFRDPKATRRAFAAAARLESQVAALIGDGPALLARLQGGPPPL